jgi:hypothetical protein
MTRLVRMTLLAAACAFAIAAIPTRIFAASCGIDLVGNPSLDAIQQAVEGGACDLTCDYNSLYAEADLSAIGEGGSITLTCNTLFGNGSPLITCSAGPLDLGCSAQGGLDHNYASCTCTYSPEGVAVLRTAICQC